MAMKDCKKRKRPDRKTCPADGKEVCFKLQFIRPLNFARRYATIVEPKTAKDGGKIYREYKEEYYVRRMER